jgi:hypothetical protein
MHVVVPSNAWMGQFKQSDRSSLQATTPISPPPNATDVRRSTSTGSPTSPPFPRALPRPGFAPTGQATNLQILSAIQSGASGTGGWSNFMVHATSLAAPERTRFLEQLATVQSTLERRIRSVQNSLAHHMHSISETPEEEKAAAAALAETEGVAKETEKLVRQLGLADTVDAAVENARSDVAALSGNESQRVVHIV